MRIESDCTQATQGVVAFCPLGKLRFYGCDEGANGRKVLVVGAKFSGEFPDPLNRVKIGTVGWKVIELKASLMFLAPVTTVERQEFAAAC